MLTTETWINTIEEPFQSFTATVGDGTWMDRKLVIGLYRYQIALRIRESEAGGRIFSNFPNFIHQIVSGACEFIP